MGLSPYLSILAPEILQLIIEHTHASAHWPLAQTCKRIYFNSQPILDRHSKASHEFRIVSDLNPQTIPNLLWSVFSHGATSIEAWHVREFEVWGERYMDHEAWEVNADTGELTVKEGAVPSSLDIDYLCDKMPKLPDFHGQHQDLNDYTRRSLKKGADSFTKALLLAYLPRIQALRYAQADDDYEHESLNVLCGFIYWCESAGIWLPGLKSLEKVAVAIGLNRVNTEVIPPEYLKRNADEFCALLCLPSLSEVYFAHLRGNLPLRDTSKLFPDDIRPSLAKTSPVRNIILDMLEDDLSDRLVDFITSTPSGLQNLAIRFDRMNYNDTLESAGRLVGKLSKHQGLSLQRLCIHDDRSDDPSDLNWRSLDELTTFENLRVVNLSWAAVEASLDPAEGLQSRPELLERLFEIFRCGMPVKMEIVAVDEFERDDSVFLKDKIGVPDLGYVDDALAAMVKSERYKNLEAIFLQGIQDKLSCIVGTKFQFPNTLKAAQERGIYVHIEGSKSPPGLSSNGEFVPFPRRDCMVTGRFEAEDREYLYCTKVLR